MYIKLNNVSHEYNEGTPMAQRVIHNISLEIKQGSFTCIIGHTGSGKSTLMQHLNALLLPSNGKLEVPGGTVEAGIKTNAKEIKQIRQNVGLVFQFPEYQLFETTVLKDIMFGPKNYGNTADEAEILAKKAARTVGLADEILEKSPFELSGGGMRRVAIAGILSMEPDVIVLDEPTAGLDPRGREEILKIFYKLQQEGKTIIVATHDMDIVARYADNVIVMCDGKKLMEGSPKEVFSQKSVINKAGVYLPTAAGIFSEVYKTDELPLTLDEFVDLIAKRKKVEYEN